MVLDLEGSHIILDSFYLQISIKGTHLLVARLPALPFPRQIGSGQKLLNVGVYKWEEHKMKNWS